jgi:hypothetical protein
MMPVILQLLNRGGLAIVAMQQIPQGFFFLRMRGFFSRMPGILKISEELRLF